MAQVHAWQEHDYSTLKPWGRQWETRSKIVTALVFIFAVIAIDHPGLVMAALVFVLGAAKFMGISYRYLGRKLLILVPFLALMSIPLLFGSGLPVAAENYHFALLIIFKAMTGMTVMLVMTATQPLQDLLESMAHLKIPAPIIAVLFLACRYSYLFIQELKSMQRALNSRCLSPALNLNALKVYGELTGGVFIKSLNRSEEVYHAMQCRCFNGGLTTTTPKKIKGKDVLISLFAMSIPILLIILEKVVFP